MLLLFSFLYICAVVLALVSDSVDSAAQCCCYSKYLEYQIPEFLIQILTLVFSIGLLTICVEHPTNLVCICNSS